MSENHDNETLFDINAYKLPLPPPFDGRARAQMLGIALVTLAQGTPYLHAGMEMLRSKSMDRNSYHSGDWFNVLDFTYGTNGFARGLPIEHENRRNYLDRAAPEQRFRQARYAVDSLDFGCCRGSAGDPRQYPLAALRTAADIRRRFTLWNVGPSQNPCLLLRISMARNCRVSHTDVSLRHQRMPWGGFVRRHGACWPLRLHPVQAAASLD